MSITREPNRTVAKRASKSYDSLSVRLTDRAEAHPENMHARAADKMYISVSWFRLRRSQESSRQRRQLGHGMRQQLHRLSQQRLELLLERLA